MNLICVAIQAADDYRSDVPKMSGGDGEGKRTSIIREEVT